MKAWGVIVTMLALALAGLVVGGCDLIDGPRVKGPVSGQLVPVEVAQSELKGYVDTKNAEQAAREAAFRAETTKVIRGAEDQVQSLRLKFEADSLTAAAEVNALKSTQQASIDAAVAQHQSRIGFVDAALLTVQSNPLLALIPGGGLAVSAAANVWQMFSGSRTRRRADDQIAAAVKAEADARVRVESESSKAHDDAWEESKKELLSILMMARGVALPALPPGSGSVPSA